jgi:hypothetical protein
VVTRSAELIQAQEDWVNRTLADKRVRVCLHADRTTTFLGDGLQVECDYCPALVRCVTTAGIVTLAPLYYTDEEGFQGSEI